jgi:hypothetical protein
MSSDSASGYAMKPEVDLPIGEDVKARLNRVLAAV